MPGLKLLLVDELNKMYTLSDNVYVGPDSPDSDTKLWIDTSKNPPVAKYHGPEGWNTLNYSGSVETSSVSYIEPISKLVIVRLSGDQSLSVAWGMAPGQEIHLIISGSGNITIPNDEEYINMTGNDVISVSDGDYVEINIISDGTKKYIRSIS